MPCKPAVGFNNILKSILEEYLNGNKLYGDDFSPEEIENWYNQEKEAYSGLVSNYAVGNNYQYHQLNLIHGFEKLKSIPSFENVLGFGSARGFEFDVIAGRIKKITIVEPSDNLVSSRIGSVVPSYVKPSVSGLLSFPDNCFDLITCFGTLHHIPNVTYVINELIRVLRPNGFLLIREPVISMGDWRFPRRGLTKNERGIPVKIFDKIFAGNQIEIVYKEYCFTATSFLQNLVGEFFSKPIYSYRLYVLFDKYLSMLLKFNTHYHARNKIERISPNNVFYVIKKIH